ncbi:hypothetical protein N9042_01565, partial [bacterium]|nr:hypothetical protein [bacterium]
MPSTYTLNNGIELISTGEQSGTWGDTTNTNLSLLDTALDGQVTVTLPSAGTSGSPNTLAITDGAASDGRNRMVTFADGGDLGATAFVQLTPNDSEKIIYVRNTLAGSRSIILFQGTYNASNDYEVPAGTTAVVYFDGAGSGAVAANVFNNAYFDSLRLGGVSVTAIIDDDTMSTATATNIATSESIKAYVDAQVGANNELSEVLANGNTTGGNAIQMTTTDELQFRDTALKISSSADGQLDIDADTEIEIVAPTVDIDASTAMTIDTAALTVTGAVDLNTSLNVDGTITSDGLTVDGDTAANGNLTITTSSNTMLDLIDTSASFRPSIRFMKDDGTATQLHMLRDENGEFDILRGPSSLSQARFGSNGDITFYDTSGNASFVYDESAGSTFNEQGENKDFRVESDTETHMLFVDASTNRIGVMYSSPAANGIHVRPSGEAQIFIGSANSGGATLILDGDANGDGSGGDYAYIKHDTSGNLTIENLAPSGTEIAVNDNGGNIDFRVESDNSSSMLFVDASSDRVGIGLADPQTVLHVKDTDPLIRIQDLNNGTGGTAYRPYIDFWASDAKVGSAGFSQNKHFDIVVENTNDAQFRLFSGNPIVMNENGTAGGDFRVESDTNTHMLFVDAGTNKVTVGTDSSNQRGTLTVNDAKTITSSNFRDFPILALENETNLEDTVFTFVGNYLGSNRYGNIVFSPDTTQDLSYFNIGGPIQQAASGRFYGDGRIVFNEIGGSANDFRVESDSNTHMLFVDAGNNQVVVGTSSPITGVGAAMTIGGSADTRLAIDGSSSSGIYLTDSGAQGITIRNASGDLEFYGAASGEFVFNEGSLDTDFRVESDAYSHALFVDAGNGRIGINQDAPGYTVDVVGDTNGGDDGVALKPSNKSQTNILSFLGLKSTYYMQFMADSTNSGGSDYFQFHAGTQDANGELLFLGDGATTFNEGGHNRDFRVESDSNAHALFVDAGNSRVGINISGPTQALDVSGTIRASAASGTTGVYDTIAYQFSEGRGWGYNNVDDAVFYNAADGKVPFLARPQYVVINESSHDTDFRVESDSNTHTMFLDAGTD